MKKIALITWEVPRVVFVEVDFGDDGNGDGLRRAFAAEVVHHELLVRWMESEAWGQLKLWCHLCSKKIISPLR